MRVVDMGEREVGINYNFCGMAASHILRNARRIMKFLADGPSYDSVMKNVGRYIFYYVHSSGVASFYAV